MVTTDQLQSLDPYEFEEFVAALWEQKGYDTTVRQQSRDRGVDVEAVMAGTGWKEVIQVKRYSDENSVGSQQIREYATLYQQIPDANAVVVVTSGTFTADARDLAGDLRVELYAGRDVVAEVAETGFDATEFVSGGAAFSGGRTTAADRPAVGTYDSVVIDGREEVEPDVYLRERLEGSGIRNQPWTYVAEEVTGLDVELAEDHALSNPQVNLAVSQNGVEYLDTAHRLTRVPLSLVSDVDYESYVMGLRKPTRVTFTLNDGTEHEVTLQRGYKKRNVKHMAAFVTS